MLEQLAAPTVSPVSLATAKDWARETTTTSDAVISRLIRAAVAVVEKVTHLAVIYRPVREQYDYFLPYFELTGCPVLGVKSITYLDSNGAQQTLAATEYVVDKTKMAARITPAYARYFPPTRVIMNSMQVTYDIGLLVPVTSVDATANTITAPGSNKAAGDIVQFSLDGDGANASGILPKPLVAGVPYYVVNPVGDVIQVAASSGGAPIDLTDTGTGPFFIGTLEADIVQAMALLIETWHRNRADVSPQQVFQMPGFGAVEALLQPYMVRGFQ